MASSETLLERLDTLKKSFHPALRTGGKALASFHLSFNSLVGDSALRSADERTQKSVRSFVNTVTTVSSALLEIEAASEPIYEELEREIARLAQVEFKRLSLSDIPATPSQAPYIECCYMWLLGHLHNPYPSKAIRQQFARQSGAQEQDIDAWYIEARKHIGWNEIRRAYFDTRFDMIKAATRHFLPTTRRVRRTADNLSLSDDKEGIDYSYHFVNMENNARSWYSHKFFPTSPATHSKPSVEYTGNHQDPELSYPSPPRTPSLGEDELAASTSVIRQRKRPRESDVDSDFALSGVSPRPQRQRPHKRTRLSTSSATYASSPSNIPSPAPSAVREHSLSLSPSFAPSPLEEEELTLATIQPEKRKRRQSFTSDYDSDSSRAPRARRRRRGTEDVNESKMQRRISTPKSVFPTPDTSRERPSHIGIPSQLQTTDTSPAPQSLKRKRRLSDSQDQRPRKLPHHIALSVPRMQTVSNPLPMPFSFSDLEDIPTSLPAELPSFTETVDLIDMQNLDVESFDYGSVKLLTDYLSQLGTAPQTQGTSNTSGLKPVVPPEHHQPSSQLHFSANTVKPFPILDFTLASSSQLSASSHDNSFSDIHGTVVVTAPEIWQDFSDTSDKEVPITLCQHQNYNSTLAYNSNFLATQQCGVNPVDLLLCPPTIMDYMHVSNNYAMGPLGKSPPASSFNDSTVATFVMQEINKLQAQVQMYQARLVEAGVPPFQ